MIAAGAIQLTALSIGGPPVHQSMATSYDGVRRDISRFYRPESVNVDIGLRVRPRRDTVLDLRLNSGQDTLKYDARPSLKLGLQRRLTIAKGHALWVSGAAKLGGDVRHTPCTDAYGRQYHCASLTAWSDFTPPSAENMAVKLRYAWRF